MHKDSIEIKDVFHVYETQTGPLPVLKNLSLTFPKNSFTAVVGPSGCGKSTLTRLISGLLIPDSGSVSIFGEKIEKPRASVGMAFQNPVLLEWRTILQNVILPLEIVGSTLSTNQRKERARHLLKLVGLEEFEDKFIISESCKAGSTRRGYIHNFDGRPRTSAIWQCYYC